MSYATVHSCTLCGVQALPVTVEIHIGGGLPGMSIVGLPQSAVKESKDRVKAAIHHMGLNFPQVKIIVNLAPADLPKRGGRFDLPIALGILQATGQLPEQALDGLMVLGELGLTGQLRSVSGILPTAHAFAESRFSLFIPTANAAEAMRSRRTRVYAVDNLQEAFRQLKQRHKVPLSLVGIFSEPDVPQIRDCSGVPDMLDVVGQHKARRALEIAAAGGHNLLMAGPPGTGKSMLASRLPGIQPPMSEAEAMETASVASISYTGFDAQRWGIRPFRAPHHTASGVALVGGGYKPHARRDFTGPSRGIVSGRASGIFPCGTGRIARAHGNWSNYGLQSGQTGRVSFAIPASGCHESLSLRLLQRRGGSLQLHTRCHHALSISRVGPVSGQDRSACRHATRITSGRAAALRR